MVNNFYLLKNKQIIAEPKLNIDFITVSQYSPFFFFSPLRFLWLETPRYPCHTYFGIINREKTMIIK